MKLDVLVPLFVLQHACRTACSCGERLDQGRVILVGIRRGEEGQLVFFWRIVCARCNAEKEFTRCFHREEWWRQIEEWQRPQRASPMAWTTPLKGVRLLLSGHRIRKLQILGGYRGDAGPVLLLYRRVASSSSSKLCIYGLLRVEREDRVRLRNIPSDEKIPEENWPTFVSLPAGTRIDIAGREWKKMSADGIAQMLRDRVFRERRGRLKA